MLRIEENAAKLGDVCACYISNNDNFDERPELYHTEWVCGIITFHNKHLSLVHVTAKLKLIL